MASGDSIGIEKSENQDDKSDGISGVELPAEIQEEIYSTKPSYREISVPVKDPNNDMELLSKAVTEYRIERQEALDSVEGN